MAGRRVHLHGVDCERATKSEARGVGKAKGYRYYIFILFSDYTDTVVIIIRTGRTDDDERHIKGHTAVSELCAQRISCRERAKNHLGSRAGFGHAKVP